MNEQLLSLLHSYTILVQPDGAKADFYDKYAVDNLTHLIQRNIVQFETTDDVLRWVSEQAANAYASSRQTLYHLEYATGFENLHSYLKNERNT